jgi:hypothetical protein
MSDEQTEKKAKVVDRVVVFSPLSPPALGANVNPLSINFIHPLFYKFNHTRSLHLGVEYEYFLVID